MVTHRSIFVDMPNAITAVPHHHLLNVNLRSHYKIYSRHHHTTTVLRPFLRDHPGEPVLEENFWTLWCKGRLTEADTQTIWLGATASGLTSTYLDHPPFLQAGCPSCRPANSVKTLNTTTTTVLRPFVRDYPGEPVPEETCTHPPSWSSSLYHLLPSIMIHGIFPVQITCLAIFLNNLSPCPLWSTSLFGALHLIFHTFLHPVIIFFLQHMPIPSTPTKHWRQWKIFRMPEFCQSYVGLTFLKALYVEMPWMACRSEMQQRNDKLEFERNKERLLFMKVLQILCCLLLILVGSRPSDHYFRSVCLSVFLCRVFLSRLWSDFDQTRTYVICLSLVVSRRI